MKVAEPLTRYALLIGVETYHPRSGLKNLHCPANDIRLLEEMFSNPAFGGHPERTETHIDISHDEAERVLFRFLKRLGRDDVAVVHFSGHGLQDDAGGLHLCFTDTVRDELEITALAVERLRRMLDSARARKVLVTLDCCYSGVAGEQLTRDDLSSQLHKVEERFHEGAGIYVLSASGSTETAKENKELGTGIFTHHLVEGIRTGKADRDGNGLITVSEIAEYLSREVPKDSARQTPHLWAEKVSGTFVVAINRTVAAAREVARFKEALHRMIDSRAISLTFAAEIETWLGRAETTIENPGERWELMCRLADRKMTPGDFQEQWRGIAAHQKPPPQAPQPPPPERPPERPPEPLHRPDPAPPPALDPVPPVGGWFGQRFTVVRGLFAAEALALFNVISAVENASSAFMIDAYGRVIIQVDEDLLAMNASLALLLCLVMGFLFYRVVTNWRQSKSSKLARIAAVGIAPIMILVSLVVAA